MKTKLNIILLTLFLSFNLLAEERTISQLIEQREIQLPRYVLKTTLYDALVINMPYGESHAVADVDKKIIRKADICMIDLVFSDFPKGADLKELNRSRINLLASFRPDLVTSDRIKWRIIRQLDCKNEGEAKVMFHGIVIHYKPDQGADVMERDKFFANTFLPESKDIKDLTKLRKSLPDSTIFKVFERKKAWDSITVVADLTGSMIPYAAQLTLWFKLKSNDKRLKQVVFFNDGDMKMDADKRIGSIGGIYRSDQMNYDSIRKLAIHTMSRGGGGDGPENNIEALLVAEKWSKQHGDIIMIADNFAPVKDISLLSKVKKPVHIILCGSQFGINVDYLNIALATGGSVHTMENDLEDLFKKNEGEEFTFNNEKFMIVGGKVVKVVRT